jgi:hypothetical protein
MLKRSEHKGIKGMRSKGFTYGNPNEFTISWMDVTFGASGGVPFSLARFKTPEDEKEWLKAEIRFMHHAMERMERYASLRGFSGMPVRPPQN